MGGEILEFSADKLFNAGEAKGRAEGKAEGRVEGKAEGKAERSQEIYERMLAENIPAELARRLAFG